MIVSRQNQKVKDIRRLRRCKGERALLEGPHLVMEAIEAGVRLETILATSDFLAADTSSRLAASHGIPPIDVVTPQIMDYLCDADSPRGVLAVSFLPRGDLDAIPVEPNGLYLFVDGVQDPGNLGALARVAEAFGVTAMALGPGSAHPNHPRCLRASAGSLLRIEVAFAASGQLLDQRLAPVDPSWFILSPRDGVSPDQVDLKGTTVFAVGAEGPGISPAVLEMAHTRVTIPLAGQVESLNSTVAAAIALYEIRRQRL